MPELQSLCFFNRLNKNNTQICKVETSFDYDLKEWERVVVRIEQQFGKNPNLEAILYLVGMQELGLLKPRYTKEEKQELMHIAVCHLLSMEGYYVFTDKDDDGWPHYAPVKHMPKLDLQDQENLLKKQLINYFKKL